MFMKFNGKIWKAGTSYVITVPSQFIKHGLIDENKLQVITIEQDEVDDDE